LRRFAQPFFAAARRAALVPFRTCERLPRLRFASITWPETRRRLWRRRDSVATGAASRVLCLRRLRRFASVATGAASRVLRLRRVTFFFANFPEAERWRLRLAGISFSFL